MGARYSRIQAHGRGGDRGYRPISRSRFRSIAPLPSAFAAVVRAENLDVVGRESGVFEPLRHGLRGAVVLPTESVVLISISSRKISRASAWDRRAPRRVPRRSALTGRQIALDYCTGRAGESCRPQMDATNSAPDSLCTRDFQNVSGEGQIAEGAATQRLDIRKYRRQFLNRMDVRVRRLLVDHSSAADKNTGKRKSGRHHS
jgi:hypothetical protein